MHVSQKIKIIAVQALLIIFVTPAVAFAAQAASPHYEVNQVFFGAGGNLNACSATYCSKQSAGEITVGNTASNSYQAQGGFNTDRQPYIEFDVNTTNADLGTLTPNATAITTSSFTVKSYLSHGYSVINASPPPSNNTYVMKALTTPTTAIPGTEQFGINLVANTQPYTFGANPVETPDSSFSHGIVDTDYSQPNLFKYVMGDTVALSTQSSGDTTYTVSYIFNIGHLTPGGSYTFHHVLVATATF